MLLSECKSFELLPRFAQNAFIESVCSAIDVLVKAIAHRCDALPCEASAGALAACRDDELSQIADDLGVIPYYPDLPRATREDIILQAKLWTRKAGTCEALRVMVNAVFDTDTTTVEDNLDRDKFPYRYRINIQSDALNNTQTDIDRLNECLEMLGHTTTTPLEMRLNYETDLEQKVIATRAHVTYRYEVTL